MFNDQDYSTTVGAATSYYSYNEPIGKEEHYSYTNDEENWDMMEVDNEEEACYAQYDLDMANAIAEADYEDYYYEQQQQEYYNQGEEEYYNEDEEYYDDDEELQDQQNTTGVNYDYQSDSLLSLVVGVQSYLTEQSDSFSSTKNDSPLYNLQYKMYTYMRQRALELGVQL